MSSFDIDYCLFNVDICVDGFWDGDGTRDWNWGSSGISDTIVRHPVGVVIEMIVFLMAGGDEHEDAD